MMFSHYTTSYNSEARGRSVIVKRSSSRAAMSSNVIKLFILWSEMLTFAGLMTISSSNPLNGQHLRVIWVAYVIKMLIYE